MQKIILMVSFILLIQNSFAGRFYDPEFGRWLNRDPIGVEGGVNIYNSVSNNKLNGFSGGITLSRGMTMITGMPIISSGLDAFGDKVNVLDLKLEPEDKASISSKESFDRNMKGLTKVRDFVKALSNADWNKYKLKRGTIIKWDGKDYNGSQEDYLKLLNHELKSTYKILPHTSSQNTIVTELNKLTNSANGSFTAGGVTIQDYKLFTLHGNHSGESFPTSEGNIEKKTLFRRARIKNAFYLCSCYTNEEKLKEYLSFDRDLANTEKDFYFAEVTNACLRLEAYSMKAVIFTLNVLKFDDETGFEKNDITNQKIVNP